MAKAAELNAYVRPDLTEENRHAIVGGRHPLLERKYDDFRPNDFASGTEESRVKILTGPNGSGKSVYSKQTVMIMLMAHFGSFVPAERATIGMVHSFYCDIHALETVITSLSGFQADISQVGSILLKLCCRGNPITCHQLTSLTCFAFYKKCIFHTASFAGKASVILLFLVVKIRDVF